MSTVPIYAVFPAEYTSAASPLLTQPSTCTHKCPSLIFCIHFKHNDLDKRDRKTLLHCSKRNNEWNVKPHFLAKQSEGAYGLFWPTKSNSVKQSLLCTKNYYNTLIRLCNRHFVLCGIFPGLIPLIFFLSVWRRSWREHARQMEVTRYCTFAKWTKKKASSCSFNKTDWNDLPSSQKDTKSLPLAHVNDKGAESSKGKQNISLD